MTKRKEVTHYAYPMHGGPLCGNPQPGDMATAFLNSVTCAKCKPLAIAKREAQRKAAKEKR